MNIKILNTEITKPIEKDTKKIVLFLHGYGANGADLIGIADYLKNYLPNTIFYSPDAPFVCDVNPIGFQWFPLNERTENEINNGLNDCEPYLDLFVKYILDLHKLEIKDLAVIGFSQGTILSLYNFTKRKNACAGIIAFSGLFFNKFGNMHKINFPIFLHHGKKDGVINYKFSLNAEKDLKKLGFDVECKIKENLAHGIDEEAIIDAKEFLLNSFFK
tara:strand:+ start:1182 stop:1832 length:651 start_codon:yes stop_codon:yes gene_type:complete